MEAVPGRLALDGIALEGPDVALSQDDLARQTYRLEKREFPQGFRIIAENMGGNRFRVEVENVRKFRIYLSDEMGDVSKPFAVEVNGRERMSAACALSDGGDYSAALDI